MNPGSKHPGLLTAVCMVSLLAAAALEAAPLSRGDTASPAPQQRVRDSHAAHREAMRQNLNLIQAARCHASDFASTYEAIQTVVFEGYGCTDSACHGQPNSPHGMVLLEGESYDNLVGVTALGNPQFKRVEPTSPNDSFLYQKLAAALPGGPPVNGGAPMPVGGALTQDHLDGIWEWIRGGAPREGVVEDTPALFGTCLPLAAPLEIEAPDPPPPGLGLQLRQPPWPLMDNGEAEVCVPFFYDLYETDLVPEWARVPCPERFEFRKGCIADAGQTCSTHADCASAGGFCIPVKNRMNTASECVAYKNRLLLQDPGIHHSFLNLYTGAFDTTDPGWGPWMYYREDTSHPDQGVACDPLDVDPLTGQNEGCAAQVVDTVACRGQGPPDFNNAGSWPGQGGNLPTMVFTQGPYDSIDFPEGVYEVMPMRGVIGGTSHAFNRTSQPTTLSAYYNIEFADATERQAIVEPIFDATSIYTMEVEPFTTREYCRTYTVPKGGNLFRLSSHTHRFGTKFRIWGPPNQPCRPVCPDDFPNCPDQQLPLCQGPSADEDVLYVSTNFEDPVQMFFDPPLQHNDDLVQSRTYLYCSLYDNGSTPSSPSVKRRSQSEDPLDGLTPGGPCGDATVACMAGPNKGQLCNGDARVCDSAPGANDGVCDACPVRGGVTLNDEMFILTGDYYCTNGVCE